jgi:uncharacterized protein YdeI (YjbR/CyaY-like superfamily)
MAEIHTFADAAGFEGWLAEHHAQPDAIWLKIAKKGSGRSTVSSDEAVDVGLCYGWISGVRRSLDQEYFLQSYSRRRPRSVWSMVNVRKVETLLAAGRMRPPGLAEVEAAQADGRWAAAYESQKNAAVPAELEAALAADPRARAAFDSLNRTDRYALVLPLLRARTAAGRTEHLRKALARLAEARDVTGDVTGPAPAG